MSKKHEHKHSRSHHPNVHAPWQDWSHDETLHVAVAYSNPFRWATRRHLLNDFRRHMSTFPNVKLHVGELAYGDRPFEVTGEHENDIQFRTESELFHKENILNEVIRRFDPNWKYGAYIDADFTFTRYDWAIETIHKLQHHDWVQPFSTYTDLSMRGHGGHRPTGATRSFACVYQENGCKVPVCVKQGGWGPYDGTIWTPVGATGGCWAFRRDAFNRVGGLMEHCILGHGDWFMAFGLVTEPARGMHDTSYHPNYSGLIHAWQEKAKHCNRNIGFVDQHIVHHFHGSKKNRGYSSRDQILVRNQFDPHTDLRKNWQGIWELAGNKSALRDEIRDYFLARKEDDSTP